MIEVRGLTKSYEGLTAVRGVTFDVSRGAVFGFIGPNGAGKTTTIRILATLLEPTSGSVRIDGIDVVDEPERVRRVIGYMPDDFGVYEGITVQEYLDFFAGAYGLPRRQRTRTVGDVMALTDLAQHETKLVADLSKGMRQRLCLARTLVHDPKVLILDEPANGLDPRARVELRALLKELAAMGKTIVISSHILTELSDVCTEVGIIERGELLASGSLARVEQRVREIAAGEAASKPDGAPAGPGVRCSMRFATLEAAEKALELLASRTDVGSLQRRGERTLGLSWRGTPDDLHELVLAVVKERIALTGLAEEDKDLEAIFMAVTRGDLQ